jgi:hypothetical protein
VLLHGANAPFARIPREGARGADTGTQKFVMALAFSHDGSMLAAGTANGAVRLVDMTRAVAPESAEDPSCVDRGSCVVRYRSNYLFIFPF